MASRNRTVTLYVGNEAKVKCASGRKYAIVQFIWNHQKDAYVLKALFRSDNPKRVGDMIRVLGGWSWVFELKTGRKLWENNASEWSSAVQAIQNYEAEASDG